MKKLNKLFAMLIAMLGVGSLSAQQIPVAGSTYYMYNPETGLFLSRGARYGCAVWGDNFGIPITLIQNGDGFLLQYFDSPTHYVSDAWWSWADGGTDRAQTYTLNKVSEGNYKLINKTHGTNNLTLYISEGADGEGFSRQIASNGKYGDNCNENWDVWQFLTSAEREAILAEKKAALELSCANSLGYTLSDGQALQTLVGDADLFATVDKTSAINNAALTANYENWPWTGTSGNPVTQVGSGIEVFQGSGTFTQTISGLAPGLYKVTLNAFFRDGSNADCSAKSDAGWRLSNAYLEANGNQTMIADWASDRSANDAPNGPGAAKTLFDAGKYKNEVFTIVGDEGKLTITIAQPGAAVGNRWFFFANATLTYYTDKVDANAITEILNKCDDVVDLIPTTVKDELTSTKNSFENNPTIANYNTLSTTIGNANTLVVPYASLNALVELCEEYAAESYSNVATEDVRTTFTTAITTATNNGNAATTVAALEEAYSTLEAARQAYVKAAIPTTGNSFDMTFLINNAQVTSATGWTNGGTASSQQYLDAPDNTYLDWCRWDWTGNSKDMYNDVVGLPVGTYSLKAATRAHIDMPGYIYAKTTSQTYKADIHKKGNSGNELGNGWGWTEINDITVTDASLTIGFYMETSTNGVWAGADNFSLYRAYDESLSAPMQESVTALKAEAEALNGKMGADEKAALTAAIDAADASSTNPFALDAMIVALSSAIADAEASITDYEKIATYIAKADGIDASIAANYQTQYNNGTISESAETVFQNLEVATYNYVKDNFTYSVALSNTWNSTGTNTSAKEFDNEHWSGETRGYMNQNDDNSQGWNANAWSLDFDQDVTLPAGEYVFKVAGRKSAGSTLELVVTMGETVLGTVNDFPASNNTIGINKAGVTSFDPEDEAGFANNGAGRGWQWRYVKFTLNAESTVKVAVHAEANSHGQWVSFGDYTLQMTEETYLEANKGGLDAPTAAVEALVDTKPMGTAENNALKDALAMTYTTGAQLLAKIDALNTAVANAEAWVTAYNEAKAPLVAALDRFEADYNNAENGALHHMNKVRWATAISMAQAAAEAKDILDSYDGFAAATNNLVAALDAATVSVNEYAALNEAINNANTLANGGNWGDQPFQRPTSAKESLNTTAAQATYDAAEADGEDVTSVTDALNESVEAVDAIVLNAPKEGARYNMVMDYAGWEHHGKAVTYLAGGRTDAGLYNIQYYAAPNANYAQAFTFTAVEGKANCYTLSMTDVDGNERYVCTGTVYGGSADQLRTTTDAAQALAVKVIATATDGIHQLWNTEANKYIGGQDAGFFTVNSHTTFRLQEAAKATVTLTLPEVGWATLILPFDAELPEGVKAYSCLEADGDALTLTEATSLKANTPYLVNGYENDYDFSGYGLATQDSYTDGLFTGTYVDYQTTANSNTYVLQEKDGEAAFYLVGEDAQPTVGAYRIYMTYAEADGTQMFSLGRGQGTSIDTMKSTGQTIVVYDLMGRKVSTMEKGGMYIVNGKKIIVK